MRLFLHWPRENTSSMTHRQRPKPAAVLSGLPQNARPAAETAIMKTCCLRNIPYPAKATRPVYSLPQAPLARIRATAAWRCRLFPVKCKAGLTWCPEAESNHRHADFQSAALPTELSGPAPKRTGIGRLIPFKFLLSSQESKKFTFPHELILQSLRQPIFLRERAAFLSLSLPLFLPFSLLLRLYLPGFFRRPGVLHCLRHAGNAARVSIDRRQQGAAEKRKAALRQR